MKDYLKCAVMLVLILYVLSPMDICSGSLVDDVIVILAGAVAWRFLPAWEEEE